MEQSPDFYEAGLLQKVISTHKLQGWGHLWFVEHENNKPKTGFTLLYPLELVDHITYFINLVPIMILLKMQLSYPRKVATTQNIQS